MIRVEDQLMEGMVVMVKNMVPQTVVGDLGTSSRWTMKVAWNGDVVDIGSKEESWYVRKLVSIFLGLLGSCSGCSDPRGVGFLGLNFCQSLPIFPPRLDCRSRFLTIVSGSGWVSLVCDSLFCFLVLGWTVVIGERRTSRSLGGFRLFSFFCRLVGTCENGNGVI